jgi:hypothetical protein
VRTRWSPSSRGIVYCSGWAPAFGALDLADKLAWTLTPRVAACEHVGAAARAGFGRNELVADAEVCCILLLS